MSQPEWWKGAVVYQVYPTSFKDTTGSGVGDLNGITSKLSYLRDLGVDVVWLSPIYASPMKDMGYDISDYRAIHPDMGTMADWEHLVQEAHGLGLKLVMDLVVNHTSDQHPWFLDSRRGGDKKDWYYWQPRKKDGKEPNNWGAIFGGSCWEWEEQRQEYYLHVFDVSQPDLNWDNPAVREAVWDVMRFWLDKGCDGFRMDVINGISKEPRFPDVPVIDAESEFQYGLLHRFNGPRVIEYLDEMHEQVLQRYPGAFTVGETPGVATPAQAVPYVQGGKPLQMIFHFEHMYMDIEPGKKCFYHRDWALSELKHILGGFMEHMQAHDGWDSLYLENHDQPRIVSRWANDTTFRLEAAKMLALFHATGRGTLFVYQGQELGMVNPPTWTYDELQDLEEIGFYDVEKAKRPADADMSDVLAQIQAVGRDNARTPMQWDATAHAGFTTGTPWIKVNDDFKTWNAERQQQDPDSALAFWRKLLQLRKEHAAGLVHGAFQMLDWENEQVYAYTRKVERAATTEASKASAPLAVYLIICSFSEVEVVWHCPVPRSERGDLLVSNYSVNDRNEAVGDDHSIKLKPFEARLYHKKIG